MKLVLASSSPRRVFLLKEVGLKPRVMSPNVDETRKKGESPRAMIRRLAFEKAKCVQNKIGNRSAILAADTIVLAPASGKVLGKPRNRREAVQMLRSLNGKTHVVLTGYCILRGDQRKLRVVRTAVKFKKMDRKAIDRYVAAGESMDKAGAYAAQGKGMGLIESLRGSYTNVVGLPVAEVLEDLEKSFGLARYR